LKQVFFLLLLFSLPVFLKAQLPDTNFSLHKDTSAIILKDSIATNAIAIAIQTDSILKQSSINNYISQSAIFLGKHFFLNTTSKPVGMPNKIKDRKSQDLLFYFLLIVVALLSFFRFFYTRYFNTLFRVFFNTTLRQSQLTDQLLQAKLASLLFNILFLIAAGLYAYFLLIHFNWISEGQNWFFLFISIGGMTAIYLAKYITLKFTGWLTGNTGILDTYIFITFLINKIIGIILIPIIVVLAFSDWIVKDIAIIISLLVISLLSLLRFFRSYGLLQHQIKVSRFHFFLYIIGLEVLPLLLIYKGLVVLLGKKL